MNGNGDDAPPMTQRNSDSPEMARLQSTVDALAREFGSFRREIEGDVRGLREKVEQGQRTPWGVYAGWASVLLAVIAFGGALFTRDLGRVESANREQWDMMAINRDRADQQIAIERSRVEASLTDRTEKFFRALGDNRQQDDIDRLKLETTANYAAEAKAGLVLLDERLQREMGQKDETIKTAVDALDKRLQDEFGRRGDMTERLRAEQFDRVTAEVNRLRDHNDALETWMREQLNESVRQRTSSEVRIEALERDVYSKRR